MLTLNAEVGAFTSSAAVRKLFGELLEHTCLPRATVSPVATWVSVDSDRAHIVQKNRTGATFTYSSFRGHPSTARSGQARHWPLLDKSNRNVATVRGPHEMLLHEFRGKEAETFQPTSTCAEIYFFWRLGANLQPRLA